MLILSQFARLFVRSFVFFQCSVVDVSQISCFPVQIFFLRCISYLAATFRTTYIDVDTAVSFVWLSIQPNRNVLLHLFFLSFWLIPFISLFWSKWSEKRSLAFSSMSKVHFCLNLIRILRDCSSFSLFWLPVSNSIQPLHANMFCKRFVLNCWCGQNNIINRTKNHQFSFVSLFLCLKLAWVQSKPKKYTIEPHFVRINIRIFFGLSLQNNWFYCVIH